jgi:membrane-bound lytic murein transglycosylase D
VPDAKRVVVKAGRKDTVVSVARRYGVSPRQVQSWNKLSGSKLVAGQSLVLMVRPNSAAAARAERGDDGDDTPARGAAQGKSHGKTVAAKSEKTSKSTKSEKAEKAEPRKHVVVEASPRKGTAKSTSKPAPAAPAKPAAAKSAKGHSR